MKMQPVVLYRNCPEWKQEEDCAVKSFSCFDSRSLITDSLVIPRYSALPFYKELETDLNYNGSVLINTYNQHRYIADLGEWYMDLRGLTPRTWDDVSKIPDEGPFVLKGETNSKKYNWNTHMFANNKKEAIKVHSNLLEDSLISSQKIYIREYIPLEKLSDGLQGLPITREYRFFVYKRIILSGGFYWSSHVDQVSGVDPEEVPKDFLNEVIDKVQNSEIYPPDFYVIDVAKTMTGDWIVIELNDGSMSGLSENDPCVMYGNLRIAIEKDWNK
jgi:hypothetical protein